MKLSDFNFSKGEEIKIIRKQLEEAFVIFKREAMGEDDFPMMCELHDVFGTSDTGHHNCLGCNFADSVFLIDNFLQTYNLQKTVQVTYSTLIILAYLLVERIDTIFDIIELNSIYRKQHFKVLLEIRRWANFLKHPKAFLLTHHPVFSFHGSRKNKALWENANIVIDRAFIDKYYANNEKNEELSKKLENKEAVLVVFPDAVRLVKALCKAMHDCVEVINNNLVYQSIVQDRTTFHDYWLDTETLPETANAP